MMATKDIFKLGTRILIGAFFITTAILKLLSIDEFEIYIYSFNIFNYVTGTVLARLLIACEFLLGFFLIFKILYKQVWWLTMAMMMGFTLFLVYVALFRNDTNCHCFGDFVELDPVSSIIKNIITMLLLLIVRKEKDWHFRFQKIIAMLGVIVALVIPFAVFPMDTLYNKIVSPNDKINESAFIKQQSDSSLMELNIGEGDYMVAFIAAGCKYCKISGKKINSIFENNKLDKSKLKMLIWGTEQKIEEYKQITGADSFEYYLINPVAAVNITYGHFPSFAFVHNGKIVKSFDYRGIKESEVCEFLIQ
ncbi:MAG: DoxX family protein [Bacteroidales bacterium]